jgi:hypothetical protein
MDNSPNAAMTPIVGVCVRYCVGDQIKDVWLDMGKITALAWGDDNVAFHKGSTSHDPNKHLPAEKEAPDCSTERVQTVNTGMCWWDGKAWVCGD